MGDRPRLSNEHIGPTRIVSYLFWYSRPRNRTSRHFLLSTYFRNCFCFVNNPGTRSSLDKIREKSMDECKLRMMGGRLI